MDCTFFVYRLCSNLNSIFSILNVIIMKNRLLASKNSSFWKLSLIFLLTFFIKKTCDAKFTGNERILMCEGLYLSNLSLTRKIDGWLDL